MFLNKAALRPVPQFAVVDYESLEQVEVSLDDDSLQERLDRGYADLDRKQPVLAEWMAEVLTLSGDELVQSLGYFLTVTVYLAFQEAFPTRLSQVDQGELDIAEATLEADEELRAGDPLETLDSDDVLAMSQPAVLSFVQHHIHEALDQSEGEINLSELDEMYRAMLVFVIALSHAVADPTGAEKTFD